MKTFHLISLGALTALFISWAGTAAADQSGVITGQLKYINASSGFCPTSAPSCQGWRFLQSQTGSSGDFVRWTYADVSSPTLLPFPLGANGTNATGNFTISWVAFNNNPITDAVVEWYGQDVDHGFIVHTSQGTLNVATCGPITLQNGTTAAHPQNIGTCTWQVVEWMNAANNASDAYTQFLTSSILANDMHDADIRMNSTKGGDCPTACTNWYQNNGNGRIDIPTNDGFDRLWRVDHELGHLAVHNGSLNRTTAYESDAENSFEMDRDGSGWSNLSQEYYGSATNEAAATFMGSHANYAPNAANPLQCRALSGACPGVFENIMEFSPVSVWPTLHFRNEASAQLCHTLVLGSDR